MRVDSTAQPPRELLKECTSVAKSSISGVLGKYLGTWYGSSSSGSGQARRAQSGLKP